jgi:hypothetical protein
MLQSFQQELKLSNQSMCGTEEDLFNVLPIIYSQILMIK